MGGRGGTINHGDAKPGAGEAAAERAANRPGANDAHVISHYAALRHGASAQI
jgi:hypothetical protein